MVLLPIQPTAHILRVAPGSHWQVFETIIDERGHVRPIRRSRRFDGAHQVVFQNRAHERAGRNPLVRVKVE